MLALWLAAGVLGKPANDVEQPQPQPQPIGGGPALGPAKPRGPRLIYVRRTVQDAAEKARQGEAEEAARLAAQAARIARLEARRLEDENAAALDAIADEIITAGDRARQAQREAGLQALGAMVAFETALELIAAMNRDRDEDETTILLLLAA
jgi:hypothetical protein